MTTRSVSAELLRWISDASNHALGTTSVAMCSGIKPADSPTVAAQLVQPSLRAARVSKRLTQRLIQVGDDVFHRLNPRAQSHQPVADAHALALLGRDLTMRRNGRV
jgi:hypothetical protein